MAERLPSPTGDPDPGPTWTEQIVPITRVAYDVWRQPGERRRMRAYGFRPSAHKEGVLKREWHQITVRVGPNRIRATHAELGELIFRNEDSALLFNGRPFDDSPAALEIANLLVSLINDYERWVEVREGRASRLRRTRSVTSDPRPINAIAETRRLQRLLGTAWGRPPTRRR